MGKWLLDWCADTGVTDDCVHDKEVFDTKEALLDRLEELKFEYDDDLEYEFGPAKKIVVEEYVFDREKTKNELKETVGGGVK